MNEQEQKSGTFEDIGRALDRELQRLIDFVNQRVVPAAREDSEALLRGAADRLHALADRLAAAQAQVKAGAPPPPELPQGEPESEPRP